MTTTRRTGATSVSKRTKKGAAVEAAPTQTEAVLTVVVTVTLSSDADGNAEVIGNIQVVGQDSLVEAVRAQRVQMKRAVQQLSKTVMAALSADCISVEAGALDLFVKQDRQVGRA
jgi:hypothetical protein